MNFQWFSIPWAIPIQQYCLYLTSSCTRLDAFMNYSLICTCKFYHEFERKKNYDYFRHKCECDGCRSFYVCVFATWDSYVYFDIMKHASNILNVKSFSAMLCMKHVLKSLRATLRERERKSVAKKYLLRLKVCESQ